MNSISFEKDHIVDFKCVQDCSKCCIEREYYPSVKFGKVGVLIMPEEKEEIESSAKNLNLDIVILPRIAISHEKFGQKKIIAFQLMGKESDGNTCPFLDTESTQRSPHGGYKCKIYENRPLACKAYPVINFDPIVLDKKCKFCENCGTTANNMHKEIESLIKIKEKMNTTASYVWRYATGIGNYTDKDEISSGWFLET